MRARLEQQVPGVLGLVDRVAVAEPAAFLLGQVQAEAQAGRVDPPVADLAQAPYSRITRPGIYDPGQALRIRDPSKTVALLGKPNPLGLRGDRGVMWPLRITCAPNGGCPDIVMARCPNAGSMMWKV